MYTSEYERPGKMRCYCKPGYIVHYDEKYVLRKGEWKALKPCKY